jgi:copper homeostasis protein CutC
LSAINEYYDCKNVIRELLKSNVEQALTGVSIKETKEIEKRLREIDDARSDYISLIASGTMDEETMDEQFQKMYAEEQKLNSRLKVLKENNNIDKNKRTRITKALQDIDNSSCELAEYNDILVRKLIECIKVNSKTEITIIFKGGIETTVEVEK